MYFRVVRVLLSHVASGTLWASTMAVRLDTVSMLSERVALGRCLAVEALCTASRLSQQIIPFRQKLIARAKFANRTKPRRPTAPASHQTEHRQLPFLHFYSFFTMGILSIFALSLLATICCCAHRAAAQPAVPGLLQVTSQEALQLPLSAIGQLSNGCTGFLIGPCHVSGREGAGAHCWGALHPLCRAQLVPTPRLPHCWVSQSVTAGSVLCHR